MSRGTKILLLILGCVLFVGIVVAIWAYQKNYLSIGLSNQNFLEGKDKNLPKKDEIVQDLPSGASTVRLNLPTNISDLMISSKTGLGGLGVETDDPTVYDFVWMDIKAGTKIKSLTSGTVTKVARKGIAEFEVTINCGYGLWAKYLGLAKVDVHEGDTVREGQEIGMGMNGSQPNSNILAFSLADENITEGTASTFSGGMLVKPLDYLKPDVKMVILQKYK